MLDLDTFVLSARMEVVPWTIEEFLRIYDEALSLWEGHDWIPDRVSGVRPTRPGFYDAFDDSRRRPQPRYIKLDGGIAFVKMVDNWKYDKEWAASVSLNNNYNKGKASQILGESQLKTTPEIALDVSRNFLTLMKGQYAYILRQQRRYGYHQMAPTESAAHLKRNYEHRMNISHWSMDCPRQIESLLLRDVFPHSFLNKDYLAASVGYSGLSLREWIEAKPDVRGALTPFTDTLTEWTPPIESIPQIREELFRNGRVFHWRFFLPTRRREGMPAFLQDGSKNPNLMEPEPLYRPDLSAPWEAEGPTPEIFTTEFYKDKDPGLTY